MERHVLSIIEANRLGRRAAAILAIANSIKGISAGWAQVTAQSEHSMQEVKNLEYRTRELMEAFSAARDAQLRAAEKETGAGLEDQAGYEVASAVDGKDALSQIGKEKFDLIITYINMPNMYDIKNITAVRGLPGCSFVPILMLTTESQAEKKAAGRKAGATGWIVKPFNADQLVATVKKLVR
jgi:two-component system, chemotaxis family, chemotaxis protein CheY